MDAVYRRLLLLYPASFRARFGEELMQFVRDEATHGRHVSPRMCADLFRSALVERTKDRAMRMKLAVGLFAVVGIFCVGALVVGLTPRIAVVFAFLALVTGGAIAAVLSVVGSRGAGAEHVYATKRFRWWWIVAGAIGLFELFITAGQLIDDPKKENVFALGVGLAFAGLIFGGMRIANRRAGNWMIATGALPMLPIFWLIGPPIAAIVVIVMALADNIRMTVARPAV